MSLPAPLRARTGSRGSKTVLIISHAFPPHSVVGALRVEKIVERFVHDGYSVDVIIAEPGPNDPTDQARLIALPAAVEVFAVPTRDHHLVQKWRALRSGGGSSHTKAAATAAGAASGAGAGAAAGKGANATAAAAPPPQTLMIPASDVRWTFEPRSLPRRLVRGAIMVSRGDAWANDATELARKLASERKYELVMTSAPPHSAHIAATNVAREFGIPVALDLRDPWSGYEIVERDFHTPWFLSAVEKRESRTLQRANLIVCNTEPAANLMRRRYPALAPRIMVVYNGSDTQPLEPVAGDGVFRLVYTGSLYVRRSPEPALEAFRRLIDAHALTPEQAQFEMMGHVQFFEGTPVMDIAKRHGVENFVRLHPPRPRADALALTRSATVLFTFGIHMFTEVPAKLFEYADYPAMFIVEAPAESAVGLLVKDTPARLMPPGDVDGIHRALEDALATHRAGGTFTPTNADGRFSRSTQLDRLMQALDTMRRDHKS